LCAAGSTANDVAILMNAAYSVLMNDTAHKLYVEDVRRFREDTGGTFTDRPVSAWSGAPDEQRAVFVDESVCIGCRNCTHAAPDTFAMVRCGKSVGLPFVRVKRVKILIGRWWGVVCRRIRTVEREYSISGRTTKNTSERRLRCVPWTASTSFSASSWRCWSS